MRENYKMYSYKMSIIIYRLIIFCLGVLGALCLCSSVSVNALLVATPSTNSRTWTDNIAISRQLITRTTTSLQFSNQKEESSEFNSDKDITKEETKTLTRQEEILKNALGIEPETAEEKASRGEAEECKACENKATKRTNIGVAVASFSLAVANYVYQLLNPVTDVQLLFQMSSQSAPLTEIGQNGKPTVVDFWAPWCVNCRESAPTLALIETEYKDRVNFVMVNGDDMDQNWRLIQRFGVDAIPHLALISKDGDVETALIGPIPRAVLEADLDVLLSQNSQVSTPTSPQADDNWDAIAYPGQEEKTSTATSTATPTVQYNRGEDLPYKMFDAFQGHDELRRVKFTTSSTSR